MADIGQTEPSSSEASLEADLAITHSILFYTPTLDGGQWDPKNVSLFQSFMVELAVVTVLVLVLISGVWVMAQGSLHEQEVMQRLPRRS